MHSFSRSKAGAEGEQRLFDELEKPQYRAATWYKLGNALVPTDRVVARNPAFVRESDCILYYGGCIFCIEAKNLAGMLYPDDDGRIIHIRFNGTNETLNPLGQALGVRQVLRKRLEAAGLANVPVVAVAVFVGKASTNNIRDLDKGLLTLADLHTFFERKTNPAYRNQPRSAVLSFLTNNLYSWDRLWTKTSESYGIFATPEVIYTEKFWFWQRLRKLHHADYRRIELSTNPAKPGINLVITTSKGHKKRKTVLQGKLLQALPGRDNETVSYDFSELTAIQVGISGRLRAAKK